MSGVAGWSDLNAVHDDVDITTGRVRQTRYLLYYKVSETVHDSILTTWLSPETTTAAQPVWRRVNTFSGWSRVSPHHTFHSAIGDIGQLQAAQSLAPFTDEAKRAAAEKIVSLWQTTNNDYQAGEYIKRIHSKAAHLSLSPGRTLTVADLPQ